MKKTFLSIIILCCLAFPNSFIGKYSATTDGGYYTHYFEFYPNGTYASTIFGEKSWGDWIKDGNYIKLYTQGLNIENLNIGKDSFYFGGVKFMKIQTSYYNDSSKNNKNDSPVGTWSDLVDSIYGKSPYKITFYSDGSYIESFAGNTSYGDWEIKSNKIILTGSEGMPTWSGKISNNKITLKSTSPYMSSFSITLSKK